MSMKWFLIGKVIKLKHLIYTLFNLLFLYLLFAFYFQMAAIVVTYLKKYTDFFSWFLQQKNCPKNELDVLVEYVGGLITKHIAQLSCNSSIIEHWMYSSTDLLFPDILITIACGMFPSVSIMNHSCSPNVTNL